MANGSACFCEDMKRPGMGELGDLAHIAEYKHMVAEPKSKEHAVRTAEARLHKAGHRRAKNKGKS